MKLSVPKERNDEVTVGRDRTMVVMRTWFPLAVER